MSGLEIKLMYDVDSGTWDAQAIKEGWIEYDTGPAAPRSPEAALAVLAMELYRNLDDAS